MTVMNGCLFAKGKNVRSCDWSLQISWLSFKLTASSWARYHYHRLNLNKRIDTLVELTIMSRNDGDNV